MKFGRSQSSENGQQGLYKTVDEANESLPIALAA